MMISISIQEQFLFFKSILKFVTCKYYTCYTKSIPGYFTFLLLFCKWYFFLHSIFALCVVRCMKTIYFFLWILYFCIRVENKTVIVRKIKGLKQKSLFSSHFTVQDLFTKRVSGCTPHDHSGIQAAGSSAIYNTSFPRSVCSQSMMRGVRLN